MFDYFRSLLASEQPVLENFKITDSTAIGDKVRSLTLAYTPPTAESPTSVVSIYWTEAADKVYEKSFEDPSEAKQMFEAMKVDLKEVETLTQNASGEEAESMVDTLLDRYSSHTDDIVDGKDTPVSMTNASKKTAEPVSTHDPFADAADIMREDGPALPEYIVNHPLYQPKLTSGNDAFSVEMKGKDTGVIYFFQRNGGYGRVVGEFKSPEDFTQKMDKAQHEMGRKLPFDVQSSRIPALVREAGKVVMQNLFFSDPADLVKYQEQMKGKTPAATPGEKPKAGEFEDDLPGEEKPEGGEDDIGPASTSYDEFADAKEQGDKSLTKRIEREIKDKVESALKDKTATMFSDEDKEWVLSSRSIGMTWGQIKDFMVKQLKYDEEPVAFLLAEIQQQEGGGTGTKDKLPVDPKKAPVKPGVPEPAKPPADLVTPETHDKLVKEVEDAAAMPMASQTNWVTKIALDNPLENKPSNNSPHHSDGGDEFPRTDFPEGAEFEEEPGVTDPLEDDVIDFPAQEALKPGDQVHVISDYSTATEGFSGEFISQYTQKGEEIAVVQAEDGSSKEVPMHRVKKATIDASQMAELRSIQAAIEEITADLDDHQYNPITPDGKCVECGENCSGEEAVPGSPKKTAYGPEGAGMLECNDCHNQYQHSVSPNFCPSCTGTNTRTIKWDGKAWVDDTHDKQVAASKKTSATPDQIAAAKAMLSNDEASTDDELIQHFIAELGMPEQEARKWVSQRGRFLGNMNASKKKADGLPPTAPPDDKANILETISVIRSNIDSGVLDESSLAHLKDLANYIQKAVGQTSAVASKKTAAHTVLNETRFWSENSVAINTLCASLLNLIKGKIGEAEFVEVGKLVNEINANVLELDNSYSAACEEAMGADAGKAPRVEKTAAEPPATALPASQPSETPTQVPTDFKEHKISPPGTKEKEIALGTEEIQALAKDFEITLANISSVEGAVKQMKAEFDKKIKEFESQSGKAELLLQKQSMVEKIAVLVSKTKDAVVAVGDKLFTYLNATDKVPVKPSDKEMLEKAKKLYPQLEKQLQDFVNGMQSQATEKTIKQLIMSPFKRSSMPLSPRMEKVADGDILDSLYESLMAAYETVVEILSPQPSAVVANKE